MKEKLESYEQKQKYSFNWILNNVSDKNAEEYLKEVYKIKNKKFNKINHSSLNHEDEEKLKKKFKELEKIEKKVGINSMFLDIENIYFDAKEKKISFHEMTIKKQKDYIKLVKNINDFNNTFIKIKDSKFKKMKEWLKKQSLKTLEDISFIQKFSYINKKNLNLYFKKSNYSYKEIISKFPKLKIFTEHEIAYLFTISGNKVYSKIIKKIKVKKKNFEKYIPSKENPKREGIVITINKGTPHNLDGGYVIFDNEGYNKQVEKKFKELKKEYYKLIEQIPQKCTIEKLGEYSFTTLPWFPQLLGDIKK